VPYSQRKYKISKRSFLALFNSFQQVVYALFTQPLNIQKFIPLILERVQITKITCQSLPVEQSTHFFPYAAYIHSLAGCEMHHFQHHLRRAGRIGTIIHHFTFRPVYPAAAFGANTIDLSQQAELLRIGGALTENRPHYLRYHIASPLNDNGIPFANIFSSNVVFVMQCRLFDGYPAYSHRFEYGIGIQRSRPPHIDAYLF
jgi:hypothetical protein